MIHRYKDDNGNFLLAVSSTIPGMTFIPPGKTRADAEHITEKQLKKEVAEHQAKLDKLPKAPTVHDRLVALEAEIARLKAKQ